MSEIVGVPVGLKEPAAFQRSGAMRIVRDRCAWDALIAAHEQGGFLQSWTWGRFKQHFGWVPVRIALPARVGKPVPAAQVLFRRVPYSPFTIGYIPRGPLLEYENEDELADMAQALDRVARRYHAISITWELPAPENPTLTACLARHGLHPTKPVQARATRLIDISPSLEEIAAQQKPKWRSNTRLARKHGVHIRPAETAGDLEAWYAILETTSARDGFTARGMEYYRHFWESTRASGDTILLLAEHEGVLLAGLMLHRFAHEATYLYGASSDASRNLMPTYLLQAEAMQWAKQRGAQRYDLFGIAESDDPDHPLAGVTRNKAGFGGRAVVYAGAFERVYHPLLHAAIQRARAGGLS
jgi:lipid II:glycine glycyltransferase (peptidoglycan interpeptide bridge formation enzyme)